MLPFSPLFAQFPTLHDHSDGRVRGARKIRFDRVLCDVPCSGSAGWHTLHVATLLSIPNLHEFTFTLFLNGQLDRRRWTFAAQPEWMGIVASTLHAANALCFLSGKEYQRISKNGELMETVSSQFHHVSSFVTFQYISAEVQSAILKRGLTILKPAGPLLYSTCSMSPIENEAVVAAALEKYLGHT